MRLARSFPLLMLGVTLLLTGVVSFASAAGVPVEPGNAKPANFEPASGCGCHVALIEQWSKSMHASALTDPIYLAKLAEGEKATNGAIGPFCKKCHGPAATMTGEIGKEPMSDGVVGGVNCSWCHQVVGLKGVVGNTSHIVELDGTRRAQLKEPQAPHKAEYSQFHETSEFCGGCHNVMHPVNGMHLEATYAEWKKGPYAAEGVNCQDCHMSRAAGVIGPSSGVAAPGGPERPNIYSMTFTGAQVELGDAEAATAMLKSAATVKLEVPDVLESGSADVNVTITNTGAGHYLPTGLTEVREMWLKVYTQDAGGAKTPVGEHRFGTILQDAKGNAPAEMWDAVKIKSDDRIPPREAVTKSYSFTMPSGVDQATLKAVLLYRSCDDELAKKAGVKNPTTEMAAATAVIFVSEEAKRAAAQEDGNAGVVGNGMKLVFAGLGLLAVFVLIVVFWFKSRKSSA